MTTPKSKKGESHASPERRDNRPVLTVDQQSRLEAFAPELRKLLDKYKLTIRANCGASDGAVIEIIDRAVTPPSPEWPYIAFFEGCDSLGAYHRYDGKGWERRVSGFKEQDFAGWGV